MKSLKFILRFCGIYRILLQCGADIDSQDVDGWTPLHAAAHWGHKDACQILSEHLSDMDSKNFVVSYLYY